MDLPFVMVAGWRRKAECEDERTVMAFYTTTPLGSSLDHGKQREAPIIYLYGLLFPNLAYEMCFSAVVLQNCRQFWI